MKEKKNLIIRDRELAGKFWKLYPAQVLNYLTSSLSLLINGIIIGNALDSISLAALGFCSPLVILLNACSGTIVTGSRIIAGRYIGNGDKEKVNQVFTTALEVAILLGLVITAALFLFSVPLARVFGADETALEATSLYLKGTAVGVIPTIMIPVLMSFLQLGGQPVKSIIATVIQATGNLGLSLLFVVVLKGNVFSAAFASSVSYYVAVVFIIICFIKDDRLSTFRIVYSKPGYIKEMFWLGSTSAALFLLNAVRNWVLNQRFMLYGGVDAVSAWAILVSAILVYDGVAFALSETFELIASVAVGEGKKKSIIKIFKYIECVGEMILMLVGGSYIILSGTIGGWFGGEGAVIGYLQTAIIFHVLFEMIASPTYLITKTNAIIGNVRFGLLIQSIWSGASPIFWMIVLSSVLGTFGVNLGLVVAEVFTFMIIVICETFMLKHVPKNLSELLLIKQAYD